MKKLTLVVIIALSHFCCVSLIAQDSVSNKCRAIVKWTPSSLVTPQTPVMQFGVEFVLPFKTHKFGLEYDYGFGVHIDSELGISDKQYSKSRFEIRYYFPIAKVDNFFVSAEGFYFPYNYRINEDMKNTYLNFYYNLTNGGRYTFDNAHVRRDVMGATLKLGYVYALKIKVLKNTPILLIEGFTGIGFRNVNQVYTDVTNKQLSTIPNDPGFGDTYQRTFAKDRDNFQGTVYGLQISLGVKVGFRIF